MSAPFSETGAQHKQVRSIWRLSLAALVIFAIFGLVVAWMRSTAPADPDDTKYERERAAGRSKNLAELRQSDHEVLTKYAWVDKAKGIVRIPIERAMELEVSALNAAPPRAAYPIQQVAPPAPAPSPSPTGDSRATPAG